MPTTKPSLVRNTAYRQDYAGIRFVEPQRVTDLAAGRDIYVRAAAMLPKLGDHHPEIPDCRVSAVTIFPMANSRTAVDAEIEYVQCPERLLLDIRVNGVTSMIPTSFDVNGEMMKVDYRKGNDAASYCYEDSDTPLGETYSWNYVKLDTLQPDTILEFIYRENGCPLSKARRFRGALNNALWQGQPARSWLCLDISGSFASPIAVAEFDMPHNYPYIVRYVFQYKPPYYRSGDAVLGGPAWDQLAVFVDQNSGRTPSDVSPPKGDFPNRKRGNGWRQFDVYGEEDFGALVLPEVTANSNDNMGL